jgi:subtilase family serine protease
VFLGSRTAGCVAVFVAACTFSSPARAGTQDIQRGVDFLYSVQDPQGGYSLNRGPISQRDTSEVVSTLTTLGFGNDPRTQAAASFLRIANAQTSDFRSRVVFALRTDPLISLVSNDLAQAQLGDGGFSLTSGYERGDVIDTALVMLALEPELRGRANQLFAALSFLFSAQQSNGGFGADDNAPDVATTALVIRAISLYRTSYDFRSQLAAAQSFLLASQAADGSFGSVRDTALATLALVESGRDVDANVLRALNALEAVQESTGAFGGGDAEVTALALRALRFSLANLKLSASDVAFSSTNPAAGDHVTITVTARNVGAQDAPPTQVKVARGDAGTVIATAMTPTIPAGASAPITVTWDTSGITGIQIINVTLDADNRLAETHEDDNTQRYVVTVRPRAAVDLALSANDLLFSPDRPVAGQPTVLRATIHNLGDDPSGPCLVEFFDGDPSFGAPSLGQVGIASVAANGSESVALPSQSFVAPPHNIHVVIVPTGPSADADPTNNVAVKTLVVANDIDLVVDANSITLTPSGKVHQNTSMSAVVRLFNAGNETAHGQIVRMFRGDPTSGGVPLGDVSFGDVGPQGLATATFSFNCGNDVGFYQLYAVADPDQQIDELNERNNIGHISFEVSAGFNLKYMNSVYGDGNSVLVGEVTQIGYAIANTGDLPIDSAVLRIYDGDPRAGGKRIAEKTTSFPAANTPVAPAGYIFVWQLVTQGMSVGKHQLWVAADPDNLLTETDETDNYGYITLTINQRRDIGIAQSDLVVAPSPNAEQDDKVTVTATIRDVVGGLDTLSPHIQLWQGDPTSGGVLVTDRQIAISPYQPATVVSAPLDTSKLGTFPIVCLIDPQRLTRDSDRTNNSAQTVFTVGPQTKPDLTVARSDLSISPKLVATDSTATISAVVHNLRKIAATGVHIRFFEGDPSQGAPPIGPDAVVDVGPLAQVTVTATLDTHGLLGDLPIYVQVDPDKAIAESNENNNEAGMPLEIHYPTAKGPSNLVATVSGQDIHLSWTAATLAPSRGYVTMRGATALGTLVDVTSTSTLNPSSSYGYHTAASATDGDPNTAWYGDSGNDNDPWFELDTAHKEYFARLDIRWDYANAPWALEAWDGVQWTSLATGMQTRGYVSTSIVVPTPIKTRKVRLHTTNGIAEISIKVIGPTTGLTADDLNQPAGNYTYSVAASDPDGIETMPSTTGATVKLPDPPSGLVASVLGNDVTLTWTASSDPLAVGSIVRRDHKPLNPSVEVGRQATATASSFFHSNGTMPPFLVNDGDFGSQWQPDLPNDPTPWLELDFAAKQLLSGIGLAWAYGDASKPIAFDIQAWDGTQFTTVVQVRNYLTGQYQTPLHFDFPDAVYTDKVRVQFITLRQSLLVNEFQAYQLTPVPSGTSTFVDHGRRVGNYAYSVTSVNSYLQEGSAQSATATVPSPAAPTNLTATVSGNSANLAWQNGSEPNLAGSYIWRDGTLLNQISNNNIAGRATASISGDPMHSAGVNDNDFGTSAELTGGGKTVDLTFPQSEIVARVVLDGPFYGDSNGPVRFDIQTFDGTNYITQVHNGTNQTVTLPQAVRTTAIRILFPVETNTIFLQDVEVYGVRPITGTSYSDASPPEGNHSYEVSAVTVVDDEGPRSTPATARTGTISQPLALTATVNGQDVQLSWLASPESGVAGYRVYRDSALISGSSLVAMPFFDDPNRPTGASTYWVTAVDTHGGETSPSNRVTVYVLDASGPAPPQNLVVNIQAGDLEIVWDDSPSADVVGYNIYKEHEATALNGIVPWTRTSAYPYTILHYFQNYFRGQPRYTYEVSAVDVSGHESARTPAVIAQVQPGTAPANVRATIAAADVSVYQDGSTGLPDTLYYRFYKDGTPILGGEVLGDTGRVTATGTLDSFNYGPSLMLDHSDGTIWISQDNAYPLVIDDYQAPTQTTPIDYVEIGFADQVSYATDLDIDIETFDGFVNVAQIRGNTQQNLQIYLPQPPQVSSHMRVTILGGATSFVSIASLHARQGMTGGNPYVDAGAAAGSHRYAVRGENRAGVFTPQSETVSPQVPSIDLAIAATDLAFSKDSVSAGDDLGLTATVHNIGDGDVDTEVSFYFGDPAAGGTLFATRTTHVAAGLTSAVFADFTVPATIGNVYVSVDPRNLVGERNERNNIAFKGLPIFYPFKAYVFTNDGLRVNSYFNNTHYLVRNQVGQIVRQAQTSTRGDHVGWGQLPEDLYAVSADQKFTALWGGSANYQTDPTDPGGSGDLSMGATGFFVLDDDNQTYANEFFFTTAATQPIGVGRIIVFARDPDTNVVISRTDTSALVRQGALQKAGDHLTINLSDLTTGGFGYGGGFPLHVVSDKPVSVLSYGDQGFPFAATNAKFTGTHFYGFTGGTVNAGYGYGLNLNVLSYQDNTNFTVKDSTTGAIVYQGTLNENGYWSYQLNDQDRYWEVTSDNTIAVTNRLFTGPTSFPFGYIEASLMSQRTGTLIGNDFLDTMPPNGQIGDARYGIVVSYYDNTYVQVQEVAAYPDSPQATLQTFTYNLSAGSFINFARPGTEPYNPDGSGIGGCGGFRDCRAKLLRIKTTRPVHCEDGYGAGGGTGGFVPLLFGSANAPDLAVRASDIVLSPSTPADHQTVNVTATVNNIGPRGAQNFFIQVWDNAPEQNGRLLHEEFVPLLVEGDNFQVATTWQAEPGLHNITVIADSRNQVVEADETNNRAYVLARTKADLVIAASDLTISPATILPRQATSLSVTVHDNGGTGVSSNPVAVYLGDPTAGGRQLARQSVDLIPGGSKTLTFAIDTSGMGAGPQAIYAMADPDNVVAESSETNNTASTVLTIRTAVAPDLVVNSVTATPSPADTAGDVSVAVAVDNLGLPTPGPVALRLYDGVPESGGIAIDTQSVAVTGPQTVTFTWHGPRTAGDHTLVAVIDPDNAIVEESEDNNRSQTTLPVAAGGSSITVATDQPSYRSGDVALLSAVVVAPVSATVTLEIRDSVGAIVAVPASAQPAADLTKNFLVLPTFLPGSYSLAGRIEQNGAVLARALSTFTITSDSKAVASLVADHLNYSPTSTVQLIGTVANSGANAAFGDLTLTYVIRDAGGVQIGTATADVAGLFPSARASRTVQIPLHSAAPTMASATLEVASGSTVVATATTHFTIGTDAAVIGEMTVAPTSVNKGQPVTVSRTLTAQGNIDASGNVVTSLLDSLSGSVIRSVTEPVSLPQGTTASGSVQLDTSTLAGRPYIVTVELFSTAGALLYRGIGGFEVFTPDTTPPVITVSGVNDGQCGEQASVTPVVSATDQSSFTLTLTLDGAAFTSGTPVTTEGTHTLRVIATDVYGNQAQKTVSFTIDRTAPTITVDGVADGQYSNAASLTPTFSGNDANLTSTTATLDGASFASGTAVTAEGSHILVVTAADCGGNQASKIVQFTIDRIAPVITIVGADATCGQASVTPSFSVVDASPTTTAATLDGAAYSSGTPIPTEGSHTLVVTATDAAGNSDSAVRNFIIDLTPPSVSVTGVSAGQVSAANVTPYVLFNDTNLTAETITLDGNPFLSGTPIGAEGDHTLVASASDCAGHTTTVQVPFAIDRTAPTIAISGITNGACSDGVVTPTIVVTDAHPSTQDIRLDGAPFATNVPIASPGHHTLTVTATDAAGNTSSQSIAFTIDMTAPAITVAGVIDGAMVNTTVVPVVTFSDPDLTTTTLTLDGAPFVSGSSVGAEGPHTLVATANDCAGNQATATVHFTIDKTPPTITVSGADAACTGSAVTPTFSATDQNGATVSATLDGATFSSGTAVTTEGSHTLVVTARDPAGNAATAQRTFIIDKTPPSVAVSGVTAGEVTANAVTPTIAISDTNLTTQSITLDGAAFTSGTTISTEGDHSLVVTASDCAGQTSTQTVAFSIDRTAPAIAISGVSNGACTGGVVTPVITVTEPHPATTDIRLDGAPFASGTDIGAPGSHTLVVTATDAAGNQASQTIAFTIDLTAPAITVSGIADGAIVNANVTPVVTFSDPDLTTSSTTLDGLPFVSGATIATEGAHTLIATANDCGGNQASATVHFVIDKTPPSITITGADLACSGGAVTPTFSATDANGAQTSATLDGAPFTSGSAVTTEGAHTLVVTARDPAGNVATAQRNFTIDHTPPSVTITGVADGLITANNVTPVVTISDTNLTSSAIRLDGNDFVSGTTVTGEGDHLLVADATDCAGQTTSKQVHFSIDRTAPVVVFGGVTSGQCGSTTVVPTVTVTEPHIASQTITLDGAPFASGTPVSAEGTHELVVSVVDSAGNRTDTSASFIIDRTPPTITLSGVVDGSFVKTNVTPVFGFNDTNLTGTSALMDGVSFASGATVSLEGAHALALEATDCAGNRAQRSAAFTIDKTPPAVSISGFTDGACYATNVTPTASYSDANLASTTLTLDSTPFTSGTLVSTEARHVVVASATDKASNATTVQESFTIDKTAPTVTIGGVTDGQITKTNLTPTISVSDTNLTSQSSTLDGVAFASGNTVSLEGDHVLVGNGTDCANQTTTVTRHFTIDKTAPVITVGGVVDGGTYTTAVTPTFSATDAHLSTVTATLDGPSFTSGTQVSSNGTHVLVVTASDRAGNQAVTTVHFTIGSSATSTVSGSQPGNGRILIAIESTNPPAPHPTFLINTLNAAGYSTVLLEGRSNWMPALRSDAYGILILYRTMSFNQDDYKEVNEAVTYGNGVIYIGEDPNLDPMQEAWGAHMGGSLNSVSSVQLSSPLGSGSVTASGTAGNLVLNGGTVIGTTVYNGLTYPAATTHAIGRNRGVLIDWNPELATSAALATMYLNAVTMVLPTPSDLVPGGAATVQYNVNAGNITDPFLLSMTLDPALRVLSANPSTTGTSWNFTLPVNQSALFTAVLGLPDSSGTYPVHTVLQRQANGGNQTLQTSDVTVSVPRSRAQLMADVKSELNALALTGSQVGLRSDALSHLNQVSTSASPTTMEATQAIAQILSAINDTRQITQFNVTSIRIDEARLLRSWETRTLP